MRKIIFFSTVEGVAETFPIIKSGEYSPAWVKQARESYLTRKEEAQGTHFIHTYRCPGIIDIMTKGFIVTMPWDVMIDTYGDGEKFKWTLPSAELTELMPVPLVTAHSPDGVAEHIPQRPGSLKTVIKFNTPWNVIAPKDVKFIIIPIPYSDTYEFESFSGILDPGISNEINIQIRWNVLNGKHVIKAGTPMYQLIPLTDEKFDIEVRSATDQDRLFLQKKRYIFNLGFTYKRGLMKQAYEKFLKIWYK